MNIYRSYRYTVKQKAELPVYRYIKKTNRITDILYWYSLPFIPVQNFVICKKSMLCQITSLPLRNDPEYRGKMFLPFMMVSMVQNILIPNFNKNVMNILGLSTSYQRIFLLTRKGTTRPSGRTFVQRTFVNLRSKQFMLLSIF